MVTVVATIALVHADYTLPPWWALCGLALVAATAERFSVEVAGHIETSVSFLPLIFTDRAHTGSHGSLSADYTAQYLKRKPFSQGSIQFLQAAPSNNHPLEHKGSEAFIQPFADNSKYARLVENQNFIPSESLGSMITALS